LIQGIILVVKVFVILMSFRKTRF